MCCFVLSGRMLELLIELPKEQRHYEFVCKSAGIPVHFCAETFANDGSLPSSIMKALKRAMTA